MNPTTHPSKPIVRRNSWSRYEVWPDPSFIAFGRMLRRARLMAGLSQERLSYLAGVSQSVISRFERGLAPGMTTERLIAIGKVLGGRLPLGFCPHDHDCIWKKIEPVAYDHPPARREEFASPQLPKPRRSRNSEISRRVRQAYDAGLVFSAEAHGLLLADITEQVDRERAQTA